jgi:hypothetical protein
MIFTMADQQLKDLVWQTADSILASGEYPTRDLICSKLNKSAREVSPLFAEWKAANPKAALEVSHRAETSTSSKKARTEDVPDPIAEMAALADKKAQYIAAGEEILTQKLYRHYRNTRQFSDPQLQQAVDEALKETSEALEEEIENFSPAALLAKYGK